MIAITFYREIERQVQQPSTEKIDYLVIGTVTQDIVPDGLMIGGTVTYSGALANGLGLKTGIVTSATADFDFGAELDGIAVKNVVAKHNSTFSNIYKPAGRIQIVHEVSDKIPNEAVPESWQTADIVHLGPLTQELDPTIVDQFSNSLIGVTPQGWLRTWDDEGLIRPCAWEDAAYVLPKVSAVILSEEDLLDDHMLSHFRDLSNLLILTRGRRGCTVFAPDATYYVPAPVVEEVNPTGAGDIFATAFLIRLQETKNHLHAAEFANKIASYTITQDKLSDKVNFPPDILAQRTQSLAKVR